jgi:putative flippase GtrA
VEAHRLERGNPHMAVDAGLYARARRLFPELLKFGLVGGIGSVIDLGGTAVLHGKYHVGPLESKAIAVTAATVFTYVGSRFWTFKDRENQSVGREVVLFIVLNVVGLLIAEVVLGFVTYVMALRGQLEYNAASVLGTGLGTLWRYYAYKRWVFLAPAGQADAADPQSAALPAFPDYPPWELDPVYLAPAPAYSAAGGRAPAYSSWTPPEHFQPPVTAPAPVRQDGEAAYPQGPRPAAGRHRRR